ncbi:MAG TPA: C39 family peptidase [Syntrophomonadaceae bacterium]|nr:C39 family peptidase [Syntrophomonadaceae bacterium]HQE23684.1 C39 family peptidase [Syntrophomonadaceae bacterium]
MNPKLKRVIAFSISFLLILSTTTLANDIDDLSDPKHGIIAPISQDFNEINSGIGYISPTEEKAAKEKSEMADKVIDIHERFLANPNSVTDKDRAILQEFINKYFKGTPMSNFLPTDDTTDNFNFVVTANPGDYQEMNLWLPGQVQQRDYWCAPASGYAVLKGRGISVTQSQLANKMGTTEDGTLLGNVAPALNQYNGINGNYFRYVLLQCPGYTSSANCFVCK